MQSAVQDSSFLIADGHHRYETALAYAEWRDHNQPNELSHYVFMFCESVDDPGLLVLPTHRVVHDRPDFSATDFMDKVRDFFELEEFAETEPKQWFQAVHQNTDTRIHRFGLQLANDPKCYVATIKTEHLSQIPTLQVIAEPLRSLDAAIVHKCFLERFLGFTAADQEKTDYISYLKSEDAFLKQMQAPNSQVGIVMNPAPLPQIRAVAEAGQCMPPKTTFFYPKLPTGLLINLID